jgi:hypothetical protein
MTKSGIDATLEAVANELLRESLKDVHSHTAKSDILTPWKEQMRREREVLVSSGVPDASWRQGLYHRAHNPTRPDLNSRDGIARARRSDPSNLPAGYDWAGDEAESA